jgi:hypothetical protein
MSMEWTNHHPPDTGFPHVPPRLPPPPRLARRRSGRRGLLGHVPWAVRLLCVAGVGLLLLTIWLAARSWLVTLFGGTVPGEVTGKSALAEGTREGRVQFSYHFRGQEYSAEDTVGEYAFERLHQGTTVKVRVLAAWPGHPLLVEPAGRADSGRGVYLYLALLGNIALGLLLRIYLREPRRQRALVREGVTTEGVIVGKEVAIGRRPSWAVQYSYQAPRYGGTHAEAADGERRPAVAEKEWQVRMAVRRADFEAAQVGAAVAVLYDPRQPSRSLIYPFAEYEAVSTPAEPG